MTDHHPTPEEFFGNPEPDIWSEIERYAKNNDEYSAALLSLRARVEQLEANAKPTPNQHPIIPPPELLDKWDNLPLSTQEIFVLAAQWGADQELNACCDWVSWWRCLVGGSRPEIGLRAARRPKPPRPGATR